MKVLKLMGVLHESDRDENPKLYQLAEIWTEGSEVFANADNEDLLNDLIDYLNEYMETDRIGIYSRVKSSDSSGTYEMTVSEPALSSQPAFLDALRDSFTYNDMRLGSYVTRGLSSRVIDRRR